MNKISAVYRITNTITGDFYIGSSKDVKRRWLEHKCSYNWKKQPNNPLYLDMKKYGLDKFVFEILAEVEIGQLKEAEQQFIETLKPTYNNRRANGWDFERHKETHRKAQKKYEKTDRRKEHKKEYQKEYQNQLCCYNGETLTLNALYKRFRRRGIQHPFIEAKKYLINN